MKKLYKTNQSLTITTGQNFPPFAFGWGMIMSSRCIISSKIDRLWSQITTDLGLNQTRNYIKTAKISIFPQENLIKPE